MKSIIVNADDLGRSVGINDGIFAAHRDGIVTSATLMVGCSGAADAAARLPDYPDLGVGLHITLTGDRPTLSPSQVPSLVDNQGCLPRWPKDLSQATEKDLRAEIRHQFDVFVELVGRLPTHLDSHHHSHRLPAVFELVASLAAEHCLPVRRSSEEMGQQLRTAGISTTDAFVERFFGAEASVETLLDIFAGLEPGVTEIMCHPGFVDDDLRQQSTYTDAREAEVGVLIHRRIRAAVREQGLEPRRFDQ